jgi:hypothetical protein
MTPPEETRSVLDLITGFLGFRYLVTPGLLVLTYYAGALGLPLVAWYATRRLKARLERLSAPVRDNPGMAALREAARRLPGAGEAAAHLAHGLPKRLDTWLRRLNPRWLPLYGIVLFFVLEVLWRVLFEFVIAYFQIRDALMRLSGG